jgi:hypothetical protein
MAHLPSRIQPWQAKPYSEDACLLWQEARHASREEKEEIILRMFAHRLKRTPYQPLGEVLLHLFHDRPTIVLAPPYSDEWLTSEMLDAHANPIKNMREIMRQIESGRERKRLELYKSSDL